MASRDRWNRWILEKGRTTGNETERWGGKEGTGKEERETRKIRRNETLEVLHNNFTGQLTRAT